MDWYRWWHGSSNDPKLRLIASECSMSVACIVGLWAHILESASSNHVRGQIDNWDAEVVSFHLGIDVETPCNAMKRRGMLHETHETLVINNWEKWQVKRERESNSSDRVKKHRELKKQLLTSCNANETPCNANETNVTDREDKIREEVNPPISPKGDLSDGSISSKQRKPRGKKQTFASWAEGVKANNEKAISDYKPVWDYAERTGLPAEFVEIAWLRFKDKYLNGSKTKTYIDWRAAFRDHVEGNYLGLWFWSEKDNQFRLTTAGIQADRSAEVAE